MFDNLGDQHALKPSVKAAKWWGVKFLTDQFVRQEYTSSTIGTLCIMVHSLVHRKCEEEWVRWAAIFSMFFLQLGLDYRIVRYRIMELITAFSDKCGTIDSELQSHCMHADAVKRELTVGGTYKDLAGALHYMIHKVGERGTFRKVMQELAEWLELKCYVKHIGEIENVSLAAGVAACGGSRRNLYGGKKLRIDEDFKAACTGSVVQQKMATNAYQFLRTSASGVHVRSAYKWIERHICKGQAAAIEQFAGYRHVRIATDGSRHGKPPTESNLFLAWVPKMKLCFPLAPQVRPHSP